MHLCTAMQGAKNLHPYLWVDAQGSGEGSHQALVPVRMQAGQVARLSVLSSHTCKAKR